MNVKAIGIAIASLLILVQASWAKEQNKEDVSPKYKLRNTYFIEHYSFDSDDTIGTSLSFVYRGIKDVTLFGENIHQEKFGEYETLFKGGAAFSLMERTSLQETVGFSSGKSTFPKFLSDTGVTYMIMDKLYLEPGYSFYLFDEVNAHAFYAGATFYPTSRFYVNAKFFRSLYDFDGEDSLSYNNSFLTKIGYYLDLRNEVTFTYATNTESFLSVDQIGNFSANTYILGWNTDLTNQWTFVTSFSYQDRKKPVQADQKRFEAGLTYTW